MKPRDLIAMLADEYQGQINWLAGGPERRRNRFAARAGATHSPRNDVRLA